MRPAAYHPGYPNCHEFGYDKRTAIWLTCYSWCCFDARCYVKSPQKIARRASSASPPGERRRKDGATSAERGMEYRSHNALPWYRSCFGLSLWSGLLVWASFPPLNLWPFVWRIRAALRLSCLKLAFAPSLAFAGHRS